MKLTAEQILEVRDSTKDTRQGFAYHLFEITDDLENRIKAGEKFEVATRKTIERKLLTDYVEFRRQLTSKKGGSWSKVVAAGSRFFKIDASPWTPKFYGDLFEIFFSFLDDSSKTRMEELSNKNQALQQVATL
jgi:hypothetical protein